MGTTRLLRFAPAMLVLWILAGTMLGRSFSVLSPNASDGQLFAYIGLKWLDGAVPYRDIWDNKPPGIFAVDSLVFSFFPKSFGALALVEGVFILGFVVTIFLLMREFAFPGRVRAFAVLAATIFANLIYYNEHGNMTEIYLLWPMALSMFFFARTLFVFRLRFVFLASVLAGVATLFKPTGLAPLLAQAMFLGVFWLILRRISAGQLAASAAAITAGVLAAWLPALVYFGSYGVLRELFDASFLYNVQYGATSQGGVLKMLSTPLNVAFSLNPVGSLAVGALVGFGLWVYAVYTAGVLHQPPERRRPYELWLLIIFWGLFDLLGAMAGGRYYAHYFLALAGSLSIAGALSFWFLTGLAEGAIVRPLNAALAVIMLGPLLLTQTLDARHLARWILIPAERPGYGAWQQVAEHLDRVRAPEDTLFTWDYFPGIYLQTGMTSASRQMDSRHIYTSQPAYVTNGAEIIREIRTHAPTFVVDGVQEDRGSMPAFVGDDPVLMEFQAFIKKEYVEIYRAGNLTLYKRADAGSVD